MVYVLLMQTIAYNFFNLLNLDEIANVNKEKIPFNR